jgi:hypothetical protein
MADPRLRGMGDLRMAPDERALNERVAGDGPFDGVTPTFVIDQTMVRGYVPLDGMRQIVAGQRG